MMLPRIAAGSISPATLDHIRQGSGRMIFTASGVNKESLESDAISHGYVLPGAGVPATKRSHSAVPGVYLCAAACAHRRRHGGTCGTEPRVEPQRKYDGLLDRDAGRHAWQYRAHARVRVSREVLRRERTSKVRSCAVRSLCGLAPVARHYHCSRTSSEQNAGPIAANTLCSPGLPGL